MQREPIICPSCEAEFDPLALVRPRRARAAAASQAKAKVAKPETPEAEEALAEEDELRIDDEDIDLGEDDNDDILPDDDGEDESDVSEVLDKAKEPPSTEI
jgi:hypothetical protein